MRAGRERDRALRVLRNRDAVVDGARGAGPDAVVVERHADVLGLAPVHVPAFVVDDERREPVRRGVEAAGLVEHAALEELPGPPFGRERDPGLVGVRRSVRVRMADAARADDHLDVDRLARPDLRECLAEDEQLAAAPDREDVDRQHLVLEELAELVLRLLVAAHEGERRVGGGEDVVVQESLLVAELVGAVVREVAVAAGLGLGRIVERSHRTARHARVVPAVVVVLAAQPAVAVQGRDEADLVAGRAELGRAHEGLQERLAVERGLHADEQPVDGAQGARVGEGEGVLLRSPR